MAAGHERLVDDGESPGYGQGREAILRATIRVVARQGLRNLTFRAVGAEAKVSHALVAHHFDTRDNLIAEALRFARHRTEVIASPTSASGSPDDFAAGTERIATEDPDIQALLYELTLESRRRPELYGEVETIYAGWRGMTRDALASYGITDPAATVLVFAALDGLVFQQLVLGGEDDTRDALHLLRHLLETLQTEANAAVPPDA